MKNKENNNEKNNAFCSICTVNYLAYAVTLNDSIRSAGHNEPHYVLIFDYDDSKHKEIIDNFNFIPVFLGELNIPKIEELIEKYNAFELSNALRPFFFDWLLKNKEIKNLIYLDTDIYVYDRFDEIFDYITVHKEVSVILTPHIYDYELYINFPNYKLEENFFSFGLYNSGFYVLKNDDNTYKFLEWLKIKLFDYCYNLPSHNMFVDQKILDFAPIFFDFVKIYKDRKYNIAHWNYTPGLIREEKEEYFVGDEKLVFFHFSQLKKNCHNITENFYFNILSPDKKIFNKMALKYIYNLNNNKYEELKNLEYGYQKLYKNSIKSNTIYLPPDTIFGKLLKLHNDLGYRFLIFSKRTIIFLIPNRYMRKKIINIIYNFFKNTFKSNVK